MQALGEFALFVARRARQKKRRAYTSSGSSPAAAAAERQAALAWLRALPPLACASLAVVIDAAFVKTLLAMGIGARQRQRRRADGGVDEFQLLPPRKSSASDATRWVTK